ncbi:response regulator [Halomonas dongshanensis]|uniref:Response regulator n=1 Tax=Halomonas dongshanensis TaxID=2890835 RepID=A0ABT2ECT2_9GAMM|nr:response regulator [Halomonas dongshanensis]MCS2609309.1 response regulator [Halomonas dongshanensis]
MSLQRILYVEDDSDIQAVAKLALEVVGGFSVKVCASGEQALAEAVAFDPQLILLDVMMPGMDGPSTLKGLRELPELAHVPVAFMTAKAQPQEIEQLVALGASCVIPKPFDPMTLSSQVTRIWESTQ